MPDRLRVCFSLALLGAPSCVIYDNTLLDESVGESNLEQDGAGGTPIDGGGGAAPDPAGSGGEASGDTDCSLEGQKGSLAEVGKTSTIENFDSAWGKIGDGVTYTGNWFVAVDSSGTGIDRVIYSQYEKDPCSSEGEEDKALHIMGDGYINWGASLDANLMFEGEPADVDMYDGVTFWARSSDFDELRVAFTDDDDSNGKSPIDTPPLLIDVSWKQYWVRFPEKGVDRSADGSPSSRCPKRVLRVLD